MKSSIFIVLRVRYVRLSCEMEKRIRRTYVCGQTICHVLSCTYTTTHKMYGECQRNESLRMHLWSEEDDTTKRQKQKNEGVQKKMPRQVNIGEAASSNNNLALLSQRCQRFSFVDGVVVAVAVVISFAILINFYYCFNGKNNISRKVKATRKFYHFHRSNYHPLSFLVRFGRLSLCLQAFLCTFVCFQQVLRFLHKHITYIFCFFSLTDTFVSLCLGMNCVVRCHHTQERTWDPLSQFKAAQLDGCLPVRPSFSVLVFIYFQASIPGAIMSVRKTGITRLGNMFFMRSFCHTLNSKCVCEYKRVCVQVGMFTFC